MLEILHVMRGILAGLQVLVSRSDRKSKFS